MAAKSSYRLVDFARAAATMAPPIELLVATDRCATLARVWRGEPLGQGARFSVPLRLRDPDEAVETLVAFDAGLRRTGAPLAGILGADETSALVAARVAARLGLPRGVSPEAAAAARDKHHQRTLLAAAGLPVPRFALVEAGADAGEISRAVGFPCVVKPLVLSASRGVIRADDPGQARAAAARIRRILARPGLLARGDPAAARILVERFVPGRELALEGLLTAGQLTPLALFDKPDPLDGPYFEETLYVTPSREPVPLQREIVRCVGRAAEALGLREGPLHAELRLNGRGPWLLELAARSIGGLCSRTLRFGAGVSLEELLLRHAAGSPLTARELRREAAAAGVMMLPIPRAGTLHAVSGLDGARGVPGIEDVVVTVRPGERLVPLPEGDRYLGFAFARAGDPAAVEAALRSAQARLRFEIGPDLPAA